MYVHDAGLLRSANSTARKCLDYGVLWAIDAIVRGFLRAIVIARLFDGKFKVCIACDFFVGGRRRDESNHFIMEILSKFSESFLNGAVYHAGVVEKSMRACASFNDFMNINIKRI